MSTLHLFTDASVHSQSRTGYGAYLCVSDLAAPLARLAKQVQTRYFADTSSSQLELQTLLWALAEVGRSLSDVKVVVYTDCQNIIGLPARRQRLESQQFCNAKGQKLRHAQMYVDFFSQYDRLEFELVKIKGHQPTQQKNTLEKIFSLVDQAARSALRAGR